MLGQIPPARRKLIDAIATHAQRKQKRIGAVDAAAFIRAYYRGVDEHDLRQHGAAPLAAAARTHFAFAQTRRRGAALVRVYTPTQSEHGYVSSHSIVEVAVDDTPFLVDSLGMTFARRGLATHLTVHPILHVTRDGAGRILAAGEHPSPKARAESWQHIEIDRLADNDACASLQRELLEVLRDVGFACADWQAMRQRAIDLAQELRTAPPGVATQDANEAADLLLWLADDHFTFLGYREYRLTRGRQSDALAPIDGSGFGLLHARRRKPRTVELTGAMRDQAREPEVLFVTKANAQSTVHRHAYFDYIGVKQFDARGEVIGERRFLGLFTSNVYQLRPRDIPLLRLKVAQLAKNFGLAPASHDGKAVMHVLDTYPRDEFFQISLDNLQNNVRGIVNIYERNQVRLLLHRERFQRYFSCLIFVPRDRYNTQVRQRIEALMLRELHGAAVESQVQLSDSTLARVHMIVRSKPERTPPVDADAIERLIAQTVRTWADRLRDALTAKHGETQGLALARQFAQAFPAAYQEDTGIEDALDDIDPLQSLLRDGDGMTLRLLPGAEGRWRLRLLRAGAPADLSDALPLLENMGLRVLTERPYCIAGEGKRPAWVQEFELAPPALVDATTGIDASMAERFRDAYLAIDRGYAESDGFNQLIVLAGLAWREAAVLRAYARYLLQTGLPFSQTYMERTLSKHAAIATSLWRLFDAQFNPDFPAARRATESARHSAAIAAALDRVQAQDEDRILRAYRALIEATLRTNYYQLDARGLPKPYLSLKFDSQRVPNLPLPKPMFEIFVCSPRVEGVHLRMGRVARGGLRWSDRREDFRTEVLGLMKAQNVKNAVIVPVGAKGGFVPKRLPAGNADDRQREGVACYQTFVRGLLDLTDNTVAGKIVAPARTVRHDEDDPYLVVAADKGTASFSDIANAVAAEYDFWLGDAFASGGSAGYDHKIMAITARGAWESVKRHFLEIGVDPQTQDFTVVGVGDMSGDVFGNGMLRSPHIRLLAAFDHRDIFIDPAPDAAASFKERERLFSLPRSSWQDYDAKAISAGGGVYSRAAKSIALSPAARAMLQVDQAALTPQAVIQAILRMPVDLLWNGGIGTYVKAGAETHAQVGDRANDGVRIDGKELRCKIVGEGGNLGFTQRGRIEYAQRGGRINADFIDNSGGVDCSDHEVNIKILLNLARDALNKTQRDRLLARMTEDVAELVLRDNILQSQALSMMEAEAPLRLHEHAHFIRSLELSAELDRDVEFLPSIEGVAERRQAGVGLTRPELAVLLCYSKMWLYKRLLASDVPEDKYLSGELDRYFPQLLQEQHGKLFKKHRLRREIVATATTNSIVNRMGPSFALRAQEDTGASIGQVARAYAIAREAFEMRDLWGQVEPLGLRTPAATQYWVLNESARLLRFVTYWLLHRHPERLDIDVQVSALRPGLRQLRAAMPTALAGAARERYDLTRAQGLAQKLPENLAVRLAQMDALTSGPDIVEVAASARAAIAHTASVYFRIGAELSLDWLRGQILALRVDGRWQAIARTTLREQLHAQQRALCAQVIESGGDVAAWLERRTAAAAHVRHTLNDMRAGAATDFATLSVAIQAVRQLTSDSR